MKRYSWIRGIAFSSLIALPLLTTGCGLLGSKSASKEIDPPPKGEQAKMDTSANKDLDTSTASGDTMKATLYFEDAKGYVAPLTLALPMTLSPAKQSLEYLVEDGPASNMLPKGFHGLLPKGTKIVSLNIDNKLATVDFSKEFKKYDAKNERKILEAITWTLTSYPTVDKVAIRVAGQDLKEMPVDKTPLNEPLTRSMGINIERGEGVDFSYATPVTLYFAGSNGDKFTYYVPVTRMIEQTDDAATAAVNELIKGPSDASELEATLSANTQINSVTELNGTVTVDLKNAMLSDDTKNTDEAIQSIVLSLTENTGDSKVTITVDGSSGALKDLDESITQPVLRPQHVNMAEM